MIKKFEVRNYKGFKNLIVCDFSKIRTYSEHKNLIKNKLSKNSIVYGKNGSGKTSFCAALMDVTYHLLDVEKDNTPPFLYSYTGNDDKTIDFKYVFQFDKKEVIYKYKKRNDRTLIYEELYINNELAIYHNFDDEKDNFINIKEAKNLRTNNLPNRLSVIKFIFNNTIINETSIIYKLFSFVKGMLYFRSIRSGNQYFGYKLGSETLDDAILKKGKLKELELFLKDMDLTYELIPLKLSSGNTVIGVRLENGAGVPLFDISSSGTRTLILFFYWLLEFDNITFLIIDEFDAYYHFKVAKKILETIISYENIQSVVTTHNVTLLNTDVTRPDCAYVIDEKGVINLSNRIDKDIRKNHNIEKMYRSGEFNL